MKEYDRILNILKQNTALDDTVLSSIGAEDDLSRLGFNSLEFINVVIALENAYGFELNDNELIMENFNTLSKISAVIKKYQAANT